MPWTYLCPSFGSWSKFIGVMFESDFEHSKTIARINQSQKIRGLFDATWAKLDARQSDFDLLLPVEKVL